MTALELIRAAGDDMAARWQRTGRAPDAFAGLAEVVLEEHALAHAIELDGLLEALTGADLPKRRASGGDHFGEPAITVYAADDFGIDLYFWLNPHTSIHDHGFAGAFSVLHGISANLEYSFEPEGAHGPEGRVRVGRLALTSAEILRRGAVRKISPGTALIHRVAHLERPSVSLAMRTMTRQAGWDQFLYLPPALAVGVSEAMGSKKVGLTRFLRLSSHREAPRLLRAALEDALDDEAFWILREWVAGATEPSDVRRLVRALELPNRPWLRAFEDAAAIEVRDAIDLEQVTDTGERALVSLATGLCDRPQLEAMALELAPDAPPSRTIARWLAGIAAKTPAIQGMSAAAKIALETFLDGGAERDAIRAVERHAPALTHDDVVIEVQGLMLALCDHALFGLVVPRPALDALRLPGLGVVAQ